MKNLVQYLTSATILCLLVYGLLKFFEIQAGSMLDWGIGFSSLMWLIVVVTVPWDAYFRAKEVLDDAKISKRKDILVIEESLKEVKNIAKRALIVAISLHIISALGLYYIAASGMSHVGYVAAIAAVLLTFLRPAVNYYEYVKNYLFNIKSEFRYPREDVNELLAKVNEMVYKIENLENLLEADIHEDAKKGYVSWRLQLEKKFKEDADSLEKKFKSDSQSFEMFKEKLEKTLKKLEDQISKNDLKQEQAVQNVREYSKMNLDKLTSDSKILDSVRELASFVKLLK
ncbi:MAG: hypothetical protein EAZ97_04665 [Bacteroidetes bacterium]|nr:MAG: hypothetical protein EAZ97_04665 [Bacteroidota bacterium]